MANYKVTDSELSSIANAIRAKRGTSVQLEFPTEFVSEIENIPSGGGGTGKAYLYIDDSSKPCIDTGVPSNTENLKIVTAFNLGRRIINDRSIFGGTWTNTGFLLIIYNNTFRFHSKAQSLDIPSSVFNSANNMFDDITIECTKDYIKVNDNEYQITATGNNTDSNLKIFTVDNNHYAAAIAFSSFKIYQDNILLRDFVPALTDNDVACFYDNVTKQYFYNSGANELYYRTVGGSSAVVQPLSVSENGTYTPPSGVDGYAPVTVHVSGGAKNILGGTTKPTSPDGSDGDIYIKYEKRTLPSGYTPIEYIQSSGTQRIDTGVPARVQLKAVIDCKWESSGDQTVLGGSSSSNDNAIYLGYNSTNNKTYVGYANSWHDFMTSAVDQVRHLWEIDLKTGAQSVTVDDIVKATTSISFTQTSSSNNLFLFSRSNGGNPFTGKIYNVKIYDYLDNEALIRNFIPAKRDSDDILGMYDLVNNVFYTNDGTGTFIAGEETDAPIDAIYLKVDGSWIIAENGDWNDVNTGGGGGPSIYGIFSLMCRRESSMSWEKTLSSLRSTWNGAGYIGADAFVGINLTNVSSISIDVTTGNSYSNTVERWYIMLAIMDTDPSKINFPANNFETNFKVYDEFHERNSSTTLTIDVSNYTGLHYLIISSIGWNAEFTNLVIT